MLLPMVIIYINSIYNIVSTRVYIYINEHLEEKVYIQFNYRLYQNRSQVIFIELCHLMDALR